jgi:hypothetical protein
MAEREAAWGRWIPRAVLALILLRGALVVCLGDVFFYGDELEKGATGKALLDGLGAELGHHRLAYHYYEGGGLAVGLLDALAFRLVGQNLLALKLVALGFDVAILLAGVSLARRAFGARAAAVFALFHVLAPESVQKNALLALGIHWQALLFCLVVLDRAGRIALEGETRRANWVTAGLAGGLGIYFNWGVAPVVAYAALAILILRPRALASRGALLGVAAFAAGLAPLLWMVSRVGGEVLDIHGAGLFGRAADRPLGAELTLFVESIYAGRGLLDLVLVLLVPLAPLAGMAALLPPREAPTAAEARARRWALYLAGYLALFTALYLASDFTVGAVAHYFQFHRLSQPWMLGTLLAAGGLAALAERGGAKRVAVLVLGGLLAFGGLRGALAVVARGNTVDFARNLGILTRTKGYRYDEYVPKVWEHLEGDDAARLAALRGFDEPERALLEYTLAVHLFAPGKLGLADVRAEAARLGFDERDALVALGATWRERYGGELPGRRAAVLEREAVGDGVRPLVEESFGRFGLGFQVTEDRLREELALGLAHDFPPEYFRGLGYRLFSTRGDRELAGYWRQTRSPCFVDHDRALGFIGAADARVAPWLLEGFRRAVAEHSLP